MNYLLKKTRKLYSILSSEENDDDPRKERRTGAVKRGQRKIDPALIRRNLESEDYMRHAIGKIASEILFFQH